MDRADHLRDQSEALSELWPRARVIVLDSAGNALAEDDGSLRAPLGVQISEGPGGVGAASFLGLDADGQAWFAIDAELVAFDAPRRVDLRAAAAHWPLLQASVFAQARALQHWRSRHRYCGVCGGQMSFARAGWTGRCGQCGTEHYPRTDPAVIVAVSDGERLLLGRQAGWPARRYSVIAGFVEPGESLEQTVAREVLEETGVRVRSCRYLGSQPWPFPSALMLGFAAHAEPDEPKTSDELEEARWFTLDEIRAAAARGERGAAADDDGPLLSPSISISRWLIEDWRVAAEARAER
ncbi:NAD(+) diphosphatase [Lysobacter sp. CA199]|uniref:NAD(+) diphosphatase n=1 Tax=Lysobacter sp. CA199 TaxID=3455608 RepID=UPI003F8D0050